MLNEAANSARADEERSLATNEVKACTAAGMGRGDIAM